MSGESDGSEHGERHSGRNSLCDVTEPAHSGSEHAPHANDHIPNWSDVTSEFREAASQLELGELLHQSSFGLFEAMSAIEMMDPKMDAGMMCNQAKRRVLNFDQAVEAGSLPLSDIGMSEQIGIIDATLACLVTWLEGHSLAQTVFTNLYLHQPHQISERPLKAFCIITLKTVELIRDRVNRASVYEEEDFQPLTYGFQTAADVTDMRALGMVKEAEEDLSRVLKSARAKVKTGEREEGVDGEHELVSALHARLKFARLFFSTLLSFSKEKCGGVSDAEKSLAQLSELLPLLEASIPLGVQPPPAQESAPYYPTIVGFEPLVNQRLLPPTFPRYTQIMDREATWRYLAGLVTRLTAILHVTQMTSLHTARHFFVAFSEQQPCVLSRSLLQLLYLPPSRRVLGAHAVVDALKDAIRAFIAPPALVSKAAVFATPQSKECVDAFLKLASRSMTSLLQTSGHNRARQRDKWGALLDDLATLQEEADTTDAYLHAALKRVEPGRQHLACFGNWVLYHTLQVMLSYTLGGFELELYAVHEYHYIFWYLHEVIYSWLLSTVKRAETYLAEQEAATDSQRPPKQAKRHAKRAKRKPSPHWREGAAAGAHQAMCGGYYRLLLGLELDGKLTKPKFDYDTEEVRYNHRFAPFSTVATPPPVAYSNFREMTDMGQYNPSPSASDMYSWSCKYFQQATSQLEGLPSPTAEELTLIKITKINFIVTKLLLGGHKRDSDDAPEFEFSLHKVFPVVKL